MVIVEILKSGYLHPHLPISHHQYVEKCDHATWIVIEVKKQIAWIVKKTKLIDFQVETLQEYATIKKDLDIKW